MKKRRDDIRIEPAVESQTPLIFDFIRKLAEYEKLEQNVVATEELVRRSLFGPNKAAEVLIAYCGQEPAGFAVFFHTYSTFLAQAGIYLEDLFVDPKYRGNGVGKAMLSHLAKLAIQRECGRLEWSVLNWNDPAIGFYRKLGATPLDEWTQYRVAGEDLKKLAKNL